MISGLISLACIFGSAVITEIVRESRHRRAGTDAIQACLDERNKKKREDK